MTGKIKVIIALTILAAAFGGGFYIKAIKAENTALKMEVKAVNETLNRERVNWSRISQAVTVASTVQGGICAAEMERRNQIDDISRDAVSAEIPQGSIDEKTNKKVLAMLNNLFRPLGHGLRQKTN